MIVVSFGGLVTGRGLALLHSLLAVGFSSENALPEVSTSMLRKNERRSNKKIPCCYYIIWDVLFRLTDCL